MARDGRSWWARLHWWDKLEMVGAALIFLFVVLAGINPVLAESLFNRALDLFIGATDALFE
ncbi:hypothetical protein [Halosegnis rubeus]|uniref:Uncharacterized protein n=1 Tax=Halosegnis rubeus TaxID=2212850 RepID=A0A5N5UJY3_9EURY|nr:hypothetical protein [Halosegnis rubeus]KAB7518781.1 hypothetical protein DP108_06335 [Halosegnis rubeus]